jgi:2-polyprenyl-6-methoxyphenol hydroxylase-like FAD-dependent oxidoreductase
MMRDVGVLIVGAGPAGLTLACELARRNVPFELVERLDGPRVGSRDTELHPRSLEVLDDLGVIEPVLAGGQAGLPIRLQLEAQPPVELMSRGPDELPYPQIVTLPQWRLEQILRDRLAVLGGTVRFGVELSALAHNDVAVVAGLTERGGDTELVRCSYLVGCDGSHSTVRCELSVHPHEHPHDDRYFLVGDLTIDGLARTSAHAWLAPDGEYVSATPLPGTSDWHFEATSPLGYVPEHGLAACRDLLHRRTGRADVVLGELRWLSGYRQHTRALDRYRYGRVLLAGDAAHTHGAPGGQGMNTGIQDAHNLGWKLAGQLGGADPILLDSYQMERSAAAGLLREAQLAGVASARGHAAVGAVVSHPAAARRLLALTAETALTYRDSPLTRSDALSRGSAPGDRGLDAPGTWPGGRPMRLLDVLRGAHWTLLGFGPGAAPGLAAVKESAGTVHCWQIARSARDGGDLISPQAHQAYGARPGSLVLVRPDGHVALHTRDAGAVGEYLSRLYPDGERVGARRSGRHRWVPARPGPVVAGRAARR